MDQTIIDGMLMPLRRGRDYCSVCFLIYRPAHVDNGAILNLHVLQKGLLVSGSIGCLVLRINSHSLVPLPKQSQLVERIEDAC